MFKILLKKQITEVWKGYFYNVKTNQKKSKIQTLLSFVLFSVLMVGIIGGMFGYLANSLCTPLHKTSFDWLYFLIFSGISIFFGAFGGVFNTFQSLYLAKDNDLLLSMPIPTVKIVFSRLLNVYLLGLMYSAFAIVPAIVIYLIKASFTLKSVIGGLFLTFLISLFVMILSCLLGFVVARISSKLKNKSYITVVISLSFIALYYYCYFNAQKIISNLLKNIALYGNNVKGKAYFLYMFGRIGEGDFVSIAVYSLVIALILAAIIYAITKSFLKIATTSFESAKTEYKEKKLRSSGAFSALLKKEFARFTSSPNYMLNCGLGIIVMPIVAILLLFKGNTVISTINDMFTVRNGSVLIIGVTAVCIMAAMNNTATPSISLEGKSLWIPKSLPVPVLYILFAKLSVQILLTLIPVIFVLLCFSFIYPMSTLQFVFFLMLPIIYSFFSALFGLLIGLKMPNLTWTNEIVPIKQSGGVMVSLLGGMTFPIIFGGLYLWLGYKLGAALYLAISCAVLFLLSLCILMWFVKKSDKVFMEL